MLDDETEDSKNQNLVDLGNQSEDRRCSESIVWRSVIDTDGILGGNYLELLKNTFPIRFGCTDNVGRSVAFIPLKNWKLDQIPKLVATGHYDKFIVSLYETLLTGETEEPMRLNSSLGENHEFILIIDARDFCASRLLKRKVTKHLFQFAKVLESDYPGSLYQCIVINCGSLWDELVLKLILRPSMWRKCTTPSCIRFYQDSSNWIDVMRSIIPSEQLPLEYGGWR
ncbi:unnamed protein product [Orchesella dallaii]|uniref:CRAL-TRIO domain-containing protein n=1 Tax=Orchesella dallaii TaxID=48710 RepID=A0ABP1RCC0_9HEXA